MSNVAEALGMKRNYILPEHLENKGEEIIWGGVNGMVLRGRGSGGNLQSVVIAYELNRKKIFMGKPRPTETFLQDNLTHTAKINRSAHNTKTAPKWGCSTIHQNFNNSGSQLIACEQRRDPQSFQIFLHDSIRRALQRLYGCFQDFFHQTNITRGV